MSEQDSTSLHSSNETAALKIKEILASLEEMKDMEASNIIRKPLLKTLQELEQSSDQQEE